MDRDQAKPAARLPAAATLDEALARMRFAVEPASFALVGFDGPPDERDLALLARLAPPAQLVREADETSVLAREADALAVAARHPGSRVERDLVWIRCEAPLGWELVGFLARVTGRLAAAGVPLGCVCSHARDHLFVARPHLERARAALRELFPEA